MITLVTGKPGSGKSYYCVRKVYDTLSSGKWLAGNLELVDGWDVGLARSNPLWRARGRKTVARAAKRFRDHVYLTPSLDELTRLRLPGCRRCEPCKRGEQCMTEARGVMLLDEAHNWLNARTWDSDDQGRDLSKAEAVANRLKIVRFFSQHRKLGWDVFLITQDSAQLDTQVRRNFEYQTHLKNLRRVKLPLLGIPIFPANLFVAITVWHDAQQSRVGVETYPLRKSVARWYRTTQTSHGLDWNDPNAIWLGQPERQASESEAPRLPSGGAPVDASASLMLSGPSPRIPDLPPIGSLNGASPDVSSVTGPLLQNVFAARSDADGES